MPPVVVRTNATSSPCALWLNASVSLTDSKCAAVQHKVCKLIIASSEPPADHAEKPTKSLVSGRIAD